MPLVTMVVLVSSVMAMLEEQQWLTLESRRLQSHLALMYHIRYDLVDIRWSEYLTETSSRTREHGSCFMIPNCRTQVDASFFFSRTCRDWNHLEKDPATSSSRDAFKTSVVAGSHEIRLHLVFIFTHTCMYLHSHMSTCMALYQWHNRMHNLVVSAMFHACKQPQESRIVEGRGAT